MKSGVLDRSRLIANILMVVLVGMNIYFSIQYSAEVRRNEDASEKAAISLQERTKIARYINLFVDKVLATEGSVSFDDRVKLENDVRALTDPKALELWNSFVNSTDSAEAQENAVRLLSYLSYKMI